jgi:hypothetical protein
MILANYKRFIFWWVSVLLVATSIFWANYFGLVNTIWASDSTKITSIILVLFTITNLALGWLAWKASDPIFMSTKRYILEKITDYSWFMSEMLMALGMFGTVVGLIHMLEVNAVSDIKDSSAIQGMLGGMWKAMGLALYTNAVGLLFSIILKFQVYFVGVENEA